MTSLPIGFAVRRCVHLCTAAVALASSVAAQAPSDTLRLAALHQRAETTDPRAAQAGILQRQTQSRVETIRREWLPGVTATASAQYLSDVARVGGLPGLGQIGPLNDQYDTYITLRQPLLDPTRKARRTLEVERLAESHAALRATLYGQRAQVNDAFFAVLHRRIQQQVIRTAIDDLQSRLRTAQLRVDAGSALPSEALLLDAELARRRQSLTDARAEELIALEQLGVLTGQPLQPDVVLLVPDALTSAPATPRSRPEYDQFERSRLVLRARDAAVMQAERPRVSLVTRTGYGRPGLNALGRSFDSYASAGVQVEWAPWNWGATRRERETLRASEELIRTTEAAFTRTIDRAASADLARMQALERQLADDDTVLALRDRILAEARLRYDEGDMTTTDYLTRINDQLVARLERDTRRLRIAETRARYLTTIGQEIK